MPVIHSCGWIFPDEVPGWLTEPEAVALARLANGQRVLEIGSYHGRSTIAMAQRASQVTSIDWHQGDSLIGPQDTLEAFRRNLERYGVSRKVRVNVGRTAEITPSLPASTFDMAFIDGGHDEENVRIDLAAALRLVKPGGIIAVHDDFMPDVQRVCAEMLGTTAGKVESLVWYAVEVLEGACA